MKLTSIIVLLLASAVSAQSDGREIPGGGMSDGKEPVNPCEKFLDAMDKACDAEEEEDDDCMEECMAGTMDGEEPPECDELKTAGGDCIKDCASDDFCRVAMKETLSCELKNHPSCVESTRNEADPAESDEQEPENPCKNLFEAMDNACDPEEEEDKEDCMEDCMDETGMDGEEPPVCDELKSAIGACVNQCVSGDPCGGAMVTALSCNLNAHHPSCVESTSNEALAMA
mmetsp:Transcript_28185/g.52001  ORF Transcript_28185/g.52001 Transcript_28185/m.52001 type:complete len:229 (+) Transcript_28185:89-775(+)